jgi:hypothetical protein
MDALWEKIRLFPLDMPGASLTFTQRLARDNGWTLDYAVQAVMEYKKFIYLVCITDRPLTPSDEVDQVWHLHLLYTQSYWDDFCQNTLGKKVQHGPTKGGQQEGDKFADWYELTRRRYVEVFGHPAPSEYWPPSKVRFGEVHFVRVNMHRHWVLPNPIYWIKKKLNL